MRIFQPIISGSASIEGNLIVTQGITGSLFGTASWAENTVTASYVSPEFISASAAASGFGGATVSASYALTASYYGGNVISASYALTASYVNTLNQNVLIVNSLTVGTSSLGANENTLVLGPSPAGGAGEGGQILLQASGGLYTSASMWDNYQNLTRLLRGTNAGSDAVVAAFNMHTKQVQFPAYTNASSFTGTATANLAVDSNGNIITVSTSGGSVFPYVGDAVITGSLTATTAIYAQANGAMYFRGGDDAELWDINVANTIGVYGQQDSTVGSIKLGSNGGTISGRSGSIGIGTTTPTLGTLQVNGNVYATSFTGSLFGSASYALTASYALNGVSGGSTDTGSLLVTASVSNNTITFTKGDASTFNITVNSGSLFGTSSWAQNALTASYVLNSISSSFTATASYFGGTVVSALTASYVNPLNQNVIITGSLTISGSATGSIFAVSASYIDFDFDSFLFSGSVVIQSVLDVTQATATFGTASISNIIATGSLFGTASWAVSSSRAFSSSRSDFSTSSSYAITASYALNAGGGSGTGFPFTGSAGISGSMILFGRLTLTGSITAANSESILYVNQALTHPTITGSKIYQTTIAPLFTTTAPNQTSTALRLIPTFTGSFSGSNTQNIIVDIGAANVGSQFTVNDTTSGSIYMVNDVSGLPIIEATSNWDVNIYDYPNTILKKTGSLIHVSGSLKTQFGISGSNAQTTSSIVVTVPSGSSTQDYNVGITKFKSFSYLTTTRPIYQDNYIRLGYDSSGTDPELTILTDPTSGRVQCHAFSTTATTVSQTSDINVASGIVDIYTNGIGSDMRLDITISAGADANYPFYRIVMFRSNTTYGGNITVLIERFFPNL